MEFIDACKAKSEICAAHTCSDCPLGNYSCQLPDKGEAKEVESVLVQWRADHPRKTMADHFFECFPNAPKSASGVPEPCCKAIGWATDDICEEKEDCITCWHREYEESHD